jgi:glucose/mannose-6-phosphate isomerase
MKSLVEKFPFQLEDAIKIGEASIFKKSTTKIDNIVITGLGGSGIGGQIISQLVKDIINIPIEINSDYNIPNYVRKNTLVIASSFSGNTEETLSSLEKAEEKGAEIACITSGGKLLETAQNKKYNHIVLPTERSPRAMLSYSLVQQLFLLHNYGFISDSFKKELKYAIILLNKLIPEIREKSKTIAINIKDKTPIIYSDSSFEGVAIRMRQQINENAKALCWHHVLPEMNHNELVGWAGGNKDDAVIVLRTDFDNPRTSVRMDVCKKIISNYTDTYFEIYAKGESRLEQALYLILFGDWLSVYLSELYNVDSIEVKVIDYLKSELAKVK